MKRNSHNKALHLLAFGSAGVRWAGNKDLPLLIFREAEVYGGVFDVGTTEVFVHKMPPPRPNAKKRDELKEVFLKWHAAVSKVYYDG